MKKQLFAAGFLPLLLLLCSCAGGQGGGITTLYGILAVCSLLLFLGYSFLIKAKEQWLLLLFASVAVVNLGYFLLALSQTVSQALMANRLAYLGSVFLPLAMLMSILRVCDLHYKKWLPYALFALGGIVFLIAASPGILPIYYKEVSIETVNGATTLVKVYGPLHNLYLFYLLGYFGAMITAIVQSASKKKLRSRAHAIILASAVFINLFLWLLEKFIKFGFEPLALSYIISELFLLGLYMMLQEVEWAHPAAPTVDQKMREQFHQRLGTLTKTERKIFDLYIEGKSSAEILQLLEIKENTLKYHNKNIYSKMEISKRKELIEQGKKYI